MNDLTRYWDALTFAAEKHADQKRKSGNVPYIIHPIRITAILRFHGFSEKEHDDLMIAALFHDLLEDTDTKIADIEKIFGEKISLIVQELSKPEQANKKEWLESFDRYSTEAKIIKMADRIDNLMDIPSSMWSEEKKKSYAEEGKIILDICGKVHSGLATSLQNVITNILNSS